MDRWEYFNPNPVKDKRTGDCVVRAICKATGFDWDSGNEIPVYYWEKE